MSLEIVKTFNSLQLLDNAILKYEQEVFANFIKQSTLKLKINEKSNITQEIVDKFKYARIYYKCKYSGNQKKKIKINLRKTFSYKDNCEAYISVNYKKIEVFLLLLV